MEIFIDQEGIEHISRHLMDAPELGSKFNGRIKDTKTFLMKLMAYLMPKVQDAKFDWTRNGVTGMELTYLFFRADRELKAILGIPEDESMGYLGVVEITDELRPRVYRQSRGPKGDDILEVNVIDGVTPESTDEYRVYLKKYPDKEGVFIANTFTGPEFDEPSLPNRRIQTENEFKESEEWWSKRAFVKW